MNPSWAAAVIALVCIPCVAQDGAVPAPRPDTPQVAQRGGEPQVRRLVSEDDAVRIDELRVRGITRRVVVQSKLPGAPAYEIGSTRDGRDTSQDRRNEGRSLWQLFAF